MLPSADQLFKEADDLIFQQDLALAHTAKSTKTALQMCFTGQQTHQTFSMGYCP